MIHFSIIVIISNAFNGAKAGAELGGNLLKPMGPAGTLTGGLLGGTLGTAAGAVTGVAKSFTADK